MTRTIARSMLMLSVSLAAMSPALVQTAPDPAEAGATAASQAPGTDVRPAPVEAADEAGVAVERVCEPLTPIRFAAAFEEAGQ